MHAITTSLPNPDMSMNISVLGVPGSGKSTQARLLSEFLKVPFLSMGEVLREKAEEATDRGRRIKQMLEAGELIDDKTFLEVFEGEIAQEKYKNGVVLDGLPRTVDQARDLGAVLRVDKVIYLNVGDNIVSKRLIERGRADDTPSVISHRLKVYHEETEPVLDWYKSRGVLFEVDGTESVEEIFSQIKAVMAR